MRVACVQDDSVVVGHGLHQRVSLLLENIIIHCHKGKMAHQQVLFCFGEYNLCSNTLTLLHRINTLQR